MLHQPSLATPIHAFETRPDEEFAAILHGALQTEKTIDRLMTTQPTAA